MTYFIFNQIHGQHTTYTVAVLATSVTDARQHIRAVWHGGKLASTVTAGNVKADCGDVTDAAGEIIHQQRLAELDEAQE